MKKKFKFNNNESQVAAIAYWRFFDREWPFDVNECVDLEEKDEEEE